MISPNLQQLSGPRWYTLLQTAVAVHKARENSDLAKTDLYQRGFLAVRCSRQILTTRAQLGAGTLRFKLGKRRPDFKKPRVDLQTARRWTEQ